jgi:hypothetical protein
MPVGTQQAPMGTPELGVDEGYVCLVPFAEEMN